MEFAIFEVPPEGLRLRGDLYGRLIPASHLQTSGAARVDFAATPDLTPARRTLGTGLPGYRVPTTEGYSVLLSPADPDRFLAALRAIGR